MRLSYLAAFSEDELKRAKAIGYDGLEASGRSWPMDVVESPEKRKEAIEEAKGLLDKYGLCITACAFYGGRALETADRIEYYRKAGEFAAELGVGVVSTMSGGNPEVGLDENIALFKETFSEVAKIYEDLGLKLAFENWHGMTWFKFPMKSMNVGFHPETLEAMFDAVPSETMGIEYDPTHMVVQGIDHIWVLKKFIDRIYHLHIKDVWFDEEVLRRRGMFTRDWFHWRLPGYGRIDMPLFMGTLKRLKYRYDGAIENEDDQIDFNEGIIMAYNVIRPMVPKPL